MGGATKTIPSLGEHSPLFHTSREARRFNTKSSRDANSRRGWALRWECSWRSEKPLDTSATAAMAARAGEEPGLPTRTSALQDRLETVSKNPYLREKSLLSVTTKPRGQDEGRRAGRVHPPKESMIRRGGRLRGDVQGARPATTVGVSSGCRQHHRPGHHGAGFGSGPHFTSEQQRQEGVLH